MEGALNDEPGIYVMFEESCEDVVDQAKEFGWDLEELGSENKLVINSLSPEDLRGVIDKIKSLSAGIGAKRLVIDSLSTVMVYVAIPMEGGLIKVEDLVENRFDIFPSIIGDSITRRTVHSLIQQIKDINLTSILISELPKESSYLSRDTVSEFACDGVIFFIISISFSLLCCVIYLGIQWKV